MSIFYGYDDEGNVMTQPSSGNQFDPNKIPLSNKNAVPEAAVSFQGFKKGMEPVDGGFPNVFTGLATGVLASNLYEDGLILDDVRNREVQKELDWSASPGYPVFGAIQAPSLFMGDQTPPPVTEQDMEIGGVLTPPPDADPSEKIKAAYENRSRNIGNPNGQIRMPKRPTMKEQSERIQQEQSKQLVLDQTKIPKWHESNAFNVGLLSMGMSILAGNDIATAFNQGATAFEQNFAVEKRAAWAEDLRAYGYDDLEIQKYIETGDNKVLTDPMERQRQARRDAMEEAKLRQLEFETSPEMQQYQMEKDMFGMEMQVSNAERAQANADRAYALQEAQFMEQKRTNKAREDAARAKTEAGGKPDPKVFMSGALMSNVNFDDLLYRPTLKDELTMKAVESMASDSGLEIAKQKYVPEFHALNQARNQASEMMGRGLSGAALSETKERPTWSNAILPTQDEIDRNDVKALNRKRNLFEALKVYSSSVAEGKRGNLSLQDVDMLGNGHAEFQVDPYGIPRAIKYRNGQTKML